MSVPWWPHGVLPQGQELARFLMGSWPQIVQIPLEGHFLCSCDLGPVSESQGSHREKGQNWPQSQVASQTTLILQTDTTQVPLKSSILWYPKYPFITIGHILIGAPKARRCYFSVKCPRPHLCVAEACAPKNFMTWILFLIRGPEYSQHSIFFTGAKAAFNVSHTEGE